MCIYDYVQIYITHKSYQLYYINTYIYIYIYGLTHTYYIYTYFKSYIYI